MDQTASFRSRRSAQAVQGLHSDVVLDTEYDGSDNGLEDDIWPSRMPSSVRRYRSDVHETSGGAQADVQTFSRMPGMKPIPPRRTAMVQKPRTASGRRVSSLDTEEFDMRPAGSLIARRTEDLPRMHWSLYLGLALVAMILGWAVLTSVANWWQVTQDDWHYGRPRTAQYDQVVGHDDSQADPSHFIALNLNRHVEIIEFPGGDGSKAKIYVGPTLIGPGQDLAPVTLSFKDLLSNGKLDMIINVQDSHFVFINDNGQFRLPHPGEIPGS